MTTTSTTTTTLAPPITQPPQIYERPRPRRPLQRRRPQPADYYEEDYEDDYIDARPARRRQPQVRARTRRPEYDDYGGQSQGQGRRYSDDSYADRRPNRNRYPAYEDDEEIEEPVRPRNRNNPDSRRNPDRKRNQKEDTENQRPPANERRPQQKPRRKPISEKRPKPKPQRYEDEDDYTEYDDRSYTNGNRYQEPENDAPKVTPTGGGSSLFSKPRAPPRISRPVPINDKKKFEYVPKSVKTTTNLPDAYDADDEYEEAYEEPDAPIQPADPAPARRPAIKPKKVQAKAKQPDYQDDEDVIDEDIAPVLTPKNTYRPANSRNGPKRPTRIETRSNKPAEIYAEDETEPEDAAAPPAYKPRNNLRPALLRNRVASQPQKQEEGRASQRRPVLENYPSDEEEEEEDEEEIIKPIPTSRPQSAKTKHAARPANIAPQGDGRANRRPDQNSRTVPEVSSNKFRNSFRVNGRDSYGSTTTTTSTTTPPPEPYESFEDEEYDDEELDELPKPETTSRPSTTSEKPQLKTTTNRVVSSLNKDIRNPNQRINNSNKDSRESNNNSHESFESGEQSDTSAEVTSVPVRETRPIVRVIKRPFLPSRGGNPYLPRGLKPLGPVENDSKESSEQPNPSNISGARLTEFHPPLVSHPEPIQEYTTTSESSRFDDLNPRAKLEEILSSDLDVTLNDALNPTLKPLSRSSPIGFSFKYNPSYYEQPIDRADAPLPKLVSRGSISYYGDHQQHPRSAPSAPANTAPASDFYADYEY